MKKTAKKTENKKIAPEKSPKTAAALPAKKAAKASVKMAGKEAGGKRTSGAKPAVEIIDTMTVKSRGTWLDRLLMKFIKDERDLPIAHLILKISFTMPVSAAVLLFAEYNILYSIIHFGLVAYFFAPYVLMLHNISHRKFFQTQFDGLTYWPSTALGIFFGQSPFTYYSHHVGMHHKENNLFTDGSTTLKYQRDSLFHFLIYFFRFLFFGIFELAWYLYKTKQYRLMAKSVLGEVFYFSLAAIVTSYNAPAGITIFFVPVLIARFGMMAGNWGQHAFVDVNDPNNCYRNSLTCINSTYNKRGFNDGYHISHHLKGSRHWSEHPAELMENWKTYEKENAIIFDKLDFFLVWLLLMTKNHKKLASYYVNYNPEKPKTTEEILALFQERLKISHP